MSRILSVLAGLLLGGLVFAQTTKVRGQVRDAGTGEPLPFVAVFFDGTSIGVSSGEDGRFYLETSDPSATVLNAQLLGYEPFSKSISRGSFTSLDILLKEDPTSITASFVKPDDRYVKRLLDRIADARKDNDYSLYERWSTDVYSKMELDATHAEELVQTALFRNTLEDVLQYRDTSAVTGESYIPILLSETSSRKYHSADRGNKEIILANRVTGFPADNFITQYSGSYLLPMNLYKATMHLFNLDVPSPLSRSARPLYNYYLVDSLYVDGRKTFCLRFHPKAAVTSPVLDGQVYVDSLDLGLTAAHVSLSSASQVNWIRHLNLDATYTRTPSGKYFPAEERLFADFSIAASDSSKIISFLGHRHLVYGEFKDEPIPESVWRSQDEVDMSMIDENADWPSLRPIPLSPREEGIVQMVDDIKQKPSYNRLHWLSRSLIAGYVEGEYSKVGIGPWNQLITYNQHEGIHMATGFRTTKKLHPSARVHFTLGYGFRDKKIKWYASGEYLFRRDVTHKLTLEGGFDYTQLGAGSNIVGGNNILTSLSSGFGDKLTLCRHFSALYEWEILRSATLFASGGYSRIFGNESVPFILSDASGTLESISCAEAGLTLRLAWDERVHRGHFDKNHLFTRYPVLNFSLTGGIAKCLSEQKYLRADGSLDWRTPSWVLGFSNIHLDGGAIWGTVPYPLLKLHEGNQTVFFDKTAFACMNYYEFASDRWASLMFEHNLDGLILGHIPLLKKLDLREILSFRAVYGVISERNLDWTVEGFGPGSAPLRFIDGLQPLGTPYMEAGIGISNIFRVLRVDYTHRITHLLPDGANYRWTVGFDVQF